MKKLMEQHLSLRMLLIALFFAAGIASIYLGKVQVGEMTGLLGMLVGLALLLVALWLYNLPFTDPKKPK